MKYILQTDNETIEIPIIRSKRKTLGLEVKYDGTVNARVPMRAPREIIERFIREHEAWIIRKRQEWSLAGNNQDDVAGEFGERKRRGANAVDPSKILPPVETKEGKAKIRQYIERQVEYYAKIMGVTYGRISMRNQKTRWGSCSSNGLKKFATVSARSPNFARITPMINANTMICSISPLARELIGLSGIIFNSVSVNEVAFIVSTDAALVLIVLMSSPTPGLIRFPTDNATVTASAVVAR